MASEQLDMDAVRDWMERLDKGDGAVLQEIKEAASKSQREANALLGLYSALNTLAPDPTPSEEGERD